MSLNKKSVDDINVKGKRVLCRCDFNVPLKNGEITDENRLVAALPTIKKLIADGGKVILCSHLGKVKTEEDKQTKTLAPVAKRLTELLGQEVKFVPSLEVVDDTVKAAVDAMKDGDVILLENTRFRAEETKNGEAFSKDLASICDVFVNDAFGTAHRAHCSNVGVAGLVDTAVVGYLMQKEIDFLGNAVENPVRPFVAILGGAKVADKLNVISNLLEKCDTLIIGGGMAYTFLKAKGYEIGKSLVDDSKIDYCKEMMAKAESLGKKLLLPVDTVMIEDFPNPIDDPSIKTEVFDADKMPADKEGCDIGPKTIELYSDAVKTAKTVVWNGPMGVFENPVLAAGTKAVAAALADTDATTIICDTLIIGGGMAYTFLKAKGYEIGKSLVDDSKIDYCKEMMAKAESLGKKLLLPVDTVMIEDFPNPIDDPSIKTEVFDADKMPADKEGCDIGPKTIELYSDAVKTAKTVVWNGPMGVFENPVLAAGTKAVAAALADTDATTIIGGGDSAAAVNQLGYGSKMSHISTGGGASLEFLEGKELPGVAAANDK